MSRATRARRGEFTAVSTEVLVHNLQNADSPLRNVRDLLPPNATKENKEQFSQFRRALVNRFRMGSREGDIRVLLELAAHYQSSLIDESVVASIFQADNSPLSDMHLQLLACLKPKSREGDTPAKEKDALPHLIYLSGTKLRRAVGDWSEREFHQAVLSGNVVLGEKDKKRGRSRIGSLFGRILAPTRTTPIKDAEGLDNLTPDKYYEQLAQYWEQVCSLGFDIQLSEALEFVIFASLTKFALQNKNVANMILHQVRDITHDLPKKHVSYRTAFIGAMSKVGTILSLQEVHAVIYADGLNQKAVKQKNFNALEKEIYRRVTAERMKNLTVIKPEERDYHAEDLQALLLKGGVDWSLFIVWFIEQKRSVGSKSNTLNEGEERNWDDLEKLFAHGRNLFELASVTFQNRICSISLIKTCMSISADAFSAAWDALGGIAIYKQLTIIDREVDAFGENLYRVNAIASTFMARSKVHSVGQRVKEDWGKFRLEELDLFFGQSNSTNLESTLTPLHSDLIDSLMWMYTLTKSKLFAIVWKETPGSDEPTKIVPASRAWLKEYEMVVNKSCTFARLRVVAPLLAKSNERKLFTETAPGFSEKGKPTWQLKSGKQTTKIADSSRTMANEYLHLQAVHSTIDNIIRILRCLHVFIVEQPSGQATLQNALSSAEHIKKVFTEEDFEAKTIADMSNYVPHSVKIHPCLVNTSAELFETIVECMPILIWLRELKDDNDFTSSIEEAMGKSEMECPVELWQEASDGKPGRVDEQKLSMLNTVRGYLYDLIYRKADRLPDLGAVTAIIAELRATDENVITSLRTANEFRVPLRDLLDSHSETGAPDRLMLLLQPTRETQWICESSPDGTFAEITLQWVVHSGANRMEKKQKLSELLDFQSSIVLTKTDQQGDVVKAAIEQFILQFGWMRMLSDVLANLMQSGHFDFQSFRKVYPFSVDAEEIRTETNRCKDVLAEWTRVVEDNRSKYYFLNFYSMKDVSNVVSTLRSIDGEEDVSGLSDDSPIFAGMKAALCLVDPSNSLLGDKVEEFACRLYKEWAAVQPDMEDLSATELLSLCGQCLDKCLADVPCRCRPVDVAEIANHPAGADISEGVSIICVNSQEVFDYVLSTYARQGYFPERELVYVCRPTTTWDDVYTLLLRWSTSHAHQRENKFYCLAGIDNISSELQRKAVTLIRENMGKAKNPLLIISGREKQYLVAQFAHLKTSIISLPVDVLRSVSKQISDQHSKGVHAHISATAGAGKSFNIRTAAAQNDLIYVPIAVMRDDNVLSLIWRYIREKEIQLDMDYVLLHFDIYDTVNPAFNALIFDLVFLGGSQDPVTGKQFFYNPELLGMAFEVATGDAIQKLRVCTLLPQEVAEVTGNSLCISRKGLRRGMGDDEFFTTRNDGTSIAVNASASEDCNAFIRLQYVCTGLDIMDANQGRFPFVFEEPNVSIVDSLRNSTQADYVQESTEGKLKPERCFELLSKALDIKKPSLWCLWSFVNVFYWQLRDMHSAESPINAACMPDPTTDRRGDKETKASYKGEVVQFLVRTAREFATRQVKQEEVQEMAAVYVSGMSRPEFNGLWERMECENDGKPAFQKRCGFGAKNFLYYRKEERSWVIDDVIDPSGPVYSRCEKGNNLDGVWSTSPDWSENPNIKAKIVKDPAGYDGEAVEIVGCEDGGSVSNKENGIYLRQPPYDNINNKPHYIKTIAGNERRHLFIGSEGGWQICPLCTDEGGVFCMTTRNLESRWRAIPPDKVEDRARLETVEQENLEEYRKKPNLAYARCTKRDREEEAAQAISLRESAQHPVGEEAEEEGEEETMEQLWDNTLKWNDSNHECLLFSNATHVVSFLSLDPERLRNRMHPGLLNHLKRNQINVGEDLNTLSSRFHEILSALTEVQKTADDAKQILDGKFCLTGDSLLKMLAIFARLRCGVPVVLMGECGCGKTMLINYLCAWMGIKLFILDVHGGTSESDILGIFARAKKALAEGQPKVFVFLDEINTCAHMGLMCEVICHRTLYGERLPEQVHVLAALNPYRRRPDVGHVPGLVFQLQGAGNLPPDPMAQLVYRVHPIPRTLRDFIFDFGALTPANEKMYILSMVKDKIPGAYNETLHHISNLIHFSQQFIRKTEKDDSAASLRDVRRCLFLIKWFQELVESSANAEAKLSPLSCATTLALAFVYFFRLSKSADREAYWKNLEPTNSQITTWHTSVVGEAGFEPLKKPGAFFRLVQHFQRFIGARLKVEDGIAMNDALMENLFVVIVCILTRIPIFVVGKPGSSKTLTMQVIASNLQGKQSGVPFWRNYPAVYIFPYQCSPMSDSHSIQHQFDMAVRYQEHAENTITVLLLDEVGLAEHSPDMPLKVLHGMLVDPPISVVGLSNWVLDPAKMNRAILLQRTEPSKDDIQLTGESIMRCGNQESELTKYLEPLAKAYHKIYTQQQGRDFVGMRDYYNLVKSLRTELAQKYSFSGDLLTTALCRNFGGKQELLDDVLVTFHTNCFGNVDQLDRPPVTHLIKANLQDPAARHLMLLTKNSVALPILFGSGTLNERMTKVLVGSEFQDDKNELHLITQINEVKLAMAEGATLVLLNHDNIYEALYDVLNQRYLYKKDNHGTIRRMLRLAIGSRSQLCNVADGFKIIVVVEQDHAYRTLDLPLLNRFEKQVLCATDVLGPGQTKLANSLSEWIQSIVQATGLKSAQEVFSGFHPGTISSAVLNITEYDESKVDVNMLHKLKEWMYRVARPVAVMNSDELKSLTCLDYFRDHSCLRSVLYKYIFDAPEKNGLCMALTHSPLSHFEECMESAPIRCDLTTIQLGELTSERQLINQLQSFFQQDDGKEHLLVVQCDPISCHQSLINHARIACTKIRAQHYSEETSRHVLFIIHLPPGTKQRNRAYVLDFISPWLYCFVDDLRPEGLDEKALDTVTLLNSSVNQLVESGKIAIRPIYMAAYQQALSSCVIPKVNHPNAFFGKRIQTLHWLLTDHPQFIEFVERTMMAILKDNEPLVRLSDDEESSRVPLQVKMVCGDLMGGSLRQSLNMAARTIIIQAFAYILRQLDCNFNLGTVKVEGNEEGSMKLWFSLLQSSVILDSQSMVTKCRIGEETYVRPQPVRNLGISEPLVSQFPFSYKIIELLNERSTRDQVEKVQSGQLETLNSLCVALFGQEIVNCWQAFANGEHKAYLYDFVSIAALSPPTSEFNMVFELYEKVLHIARSDCLSSPGAIHYTVWNNEDRLFRLSSILTNMLLPLEVRQQILKRIQSYSPCQPSDDQSYAGMQARMVQLDAIVLQEIFADNWKILRSEELYRSTVRVHDWITQFASIRSDLELYLASLIPYDSAPFLSNTFLYTLQMTFLNLRTVHLYFQEVVRQCNYHTMDLVQPRAFLDVAERLELGSVEYLSQLIKSIESLLPEEEARLIISFVRRFLQEIVFGQQEGFYNIGSKHQLPMPFLLQMEKIFAAQVSQLSHPNLAPLCEDLSLRRALLHCLVRADHHLQLEGVEAMQLFLQYCMDQETDKADWLQPNRFKNDDDKRVQVNLNEDFSRLEVLESLGRVEAAINRYATDCISKPEEQTYAGLLPSYLEKILQNFGPARVLTFKSIIAQGGIDSLGEIIRSSEVIPWMPVDKTMATGTAIDIPDPFVTWLNADTYESSCAAIRTAVTSKTAPTDQLDRTYPAFDEEKDYLTLLPSVFSQITIDSTLQRANMDPLLAWSMERLKNKSKYQYLQWLCERNNEYAATVNIGKLSGICQFQVGFHIGMWAATSPNSWLHDLIFVPDRSFGRYLIGMPDDEFVELQRASGRVGWYICPNGHKYSVGQCTMPMEKARCPECKEEIGGANHVSVKGVTKLEGNRLLGDTKPGYVLNSENTEPIRMTPASACFIRFLLHSCLLLSSCMSTANSNEITKLVQAVKPATQGTNAFLAYRMKNDWKRLREYTGLGDGDLTLLFHNLLHKLRAGVGAARLSENISTLEQRNEQEAKLTQQADLFLTNKKFHAQLSETRENLKSSNQHSMIRLSMGQDMWECLFEETEGKTIQRDMMLWRYRTPVSFRHFANHWKLQQRSILRRYNLLTTFLKEEDRMPQICGVRDVLGWHKILFDAIPHLSITRMESIDITNKDVIERLPPAKQENARQVLARFCTVFNKTLPAIELLYECNENPFIKEGRVNLDGEGKQMDENTSIAFSLPSMVTGSDKGDFINGMCTIRILELLVDSQNEVLDSISPTDASARRRFKPVDGTSPAAPRAPVAAPQEREAPKIPAVSYRTPALILENQLILYQREADFMPLLRMFAVQSLEYGQGGELSYDHHKLELALANGLLAGKRPINLCISHYQYKGDVQRMGQLSMLNTKITQEVQLSSVLKDSITADIDTQNRALRLLEILEVCIQFIVSIGSASSKFDGQMLLSTYVLDTLHFSPEEWEEVSTATIRQNIYLNNIQALYLLLESQINGNPIDDIPTEYRDPISEDQELAFRSATNKMDNSLLLSELRTFMIGQLTSSQYGANLSLKEYLGYTDIGYEDWFEEHFPDTLQLAHAVAIYKILESYV